MQKLLLTKHETRNTVYDVSEIFGTGTPFGIGPQGLVAGEGA